jgi:hypothetical protein
LDFGIEQRCPSVLHQAPSQENDPLPSVALDLRLNEMAPIGLLIETLILNFLLSTGV